MFVKESWNTKAKERKKQYHIVEAYRDEDGVPRHRYLLNITSLPKNVIDAIKKSLKGQTVTSLKDVGIDRDDQVRGAGHVALYKLWRDFDFDKLLEELTDAQRQSAFAMVSQRVFEPSSKNSLKGWLEENLFHKIFSATRVDEDELYHVMDLIYNNFYKIQKRLVKRHVISETLVLYDMTSTYFEGRKADGGEYGYSRDHRSDRYQIVIGLICNEQGIPVSVEVWPGNTTDKETVKEQVALLRENFGLRNVIFVGDKGMYTRANIDEIVDNGFDYIISTQWQTQREQLLKRSPQQMDLFDKQNVVGWRDGDKRYVGCTSKWRKQRAKKRRQESMIESNKKLRKVQKTAVTGKYYTQETLSIKINEIVKRYGVKDLWEIKFSKVDKEAGIKDKTKFDIKLNINIEGVRRRKKIEGKYVLQTSIPEEEMDDEKIQKKYKMLSKVERAFRNIKSFLKIRPVYHYKDRRIKAHVLICFLAYYIVKRAEILLREKEIDRETVDVLKDWNKLTLGRISLNISGESLDNWDWNCGEVGAKVVSEIKKVGWWKSIQAYKRSLVKKIEESS